jgi:hypothetical protein
MQPFIALALSFVLGSAALQAQVVFHAKCTGEQQGTPSTATATGIVVLDPATQTFSYTITVTGLSGPVLAAHVHKGPVDGMGGPWLDLTGGPTVWSGSSAVLTPTEVTELQTSNMYFVFHTALYVTGEIRGQITPSLSAFDAVLAGGKVVPPTASPGSASATFTLNPDQSLTYSITASGLQGTALSARIFKGLPGVSGTTEFILTGGPTTWSGTTVPLDGKQVAYLSSGLYYAQISTTFAPAGEVRGQIVPSFTPYGSGCPGPGGVPVLSGSGLPVPGGLPLLSITGCTPSSSGLLLVAFTAPSPLAGGSGCKLLVGPALPIIVTLPLGPAGELLLPAALPPDTPAPLWLQLQFFDLDTNAPNGHWYATNAMGMQVND